MEAAQQLIAKFAKTTPEIIALNNSVFSLVPSRDLLEDMKSAFAHSAEILQELNQASFHLLEAVNIDIQQRFYKQSPETIAIHYSSQELDAYRRLLKKLLVQLDANAPIFRIYTAIIRSVVKGIHVHRTVIGIVKGLCHEIFHVDPPAYELVLGQYTTEELESNTILIQETLRILEQDITRRPSVLEFAEQCRLVFKAIPAHIADRKIKMRKTTRVLQLSHYIEYLPVEKISEKTTPSLIFCQLLFEETRRFLLTQQTHLDISLNIQSLEEASHKTEHGLRYRQYALGQLFKKISNLSAEALPFISEQQLEDSNSLLQEVQNLVEDFILRTPKFPAPEILDLAEALRTTMQKLHEAMRAAKNIPESGTSPHFLALESELSGLNKFYDEALVGYIRKALRPERASYEIEQTNTLDQALEVPVVRLEKYIEGFLQILQ
jgi:hypothetical protein